MPHKILVADDDLAYSELLSGHLKDNGFTVVTAASGVETVKRIRSDQPDLIILDLKMPLGGAVSILTTIKQDREMRSIPVIACTGTWPEKEKIIREMGADHFFKKPFDFNELLSVINKILKG
ncbi:MAG: response regulator [Deltaproteobacteria bacterium]|nr:response regulator [Deltaproteobacteria bacterium]